MPSIKAFAESLDDYTGALTQEVEKLAIERAHGTLNREEQLDLLGGLQKALEERLIRPWRKRAWMGLLLGLVLAGAGIVLPEGWPNGTLLRAGAAACAAFPLVLAGYGALRIRKYRLDQGTWLKRLETTVKKGGSVFDVR